NNVKYNNDPVFGVAVPESCPDVPAEILVPKNTWKDKAGYDAQAKKLADLFIKNFEKFADKASDDVKKAGPKA
ncbi:MAG TPA: phosphoenolpyruvate carboxykinase (ATP), partial [bacterium]|nr:phosphoenolpyruvate carboxykinase (ATP) [bacterium]